MSLLDAAGTGRAAPSVPSSRSTGLLVAPVDWLRIASEIVKAAGVGGLGLLSAFADAAIPEPSLNGSDSAPVGHDC